MFFKKDKLSNFEFITVKEFLLVLLLLFISTLFAFIYIPYSLYKALPAYEAFFKSQHFSILLYFVSSALSFYIIYYFCCKKKNKSLKDGLFLYPSSKKIYFISVLIGIIMPLISLPIIFNFAPKEFYAINLAKEEGGLFYLFLSALFAPVFEEIFYRGFFFPFFQSKLNSFSAVIITALFFGISHFTNIGNAYILVSLFIFYGFVLTLLRYSTSSLIPPIITHLIHNLTLMIGFWAVGR